MSKDLRHGILFDLDGTLIDSVYEHARIWHDVLAEHGWVLPHWKVHRGVGLTSGQLLYWLLGHKPEQADALIALHEQRFLESASKLHPTTGAQALLDELEAREVPFCAVTSAGEETKEVLFKALGRTLPTSDKSGGTSKPSPEPIQAAVAQLKLEPQQATMIGDAIWDGESARRCGAHFIGLRCGGTGDDLLKQAGALWVEDSPRELIGRL
jgi:HAD superfamily hydrolase (TIGR01509 family)